MSSGHTPIAHLFYGAGEPNAKTAYAASYSAAHTLPAKVDAFRSASPAPERNVESLQNEWSECLGHLKEILHYKKDPLDQLAGHEHRGKGRLGRIGIAAEAGHRNDRLLEAVAHARRERDAMLGGRDCSARSRASSMERPAAQVRSVSVDRNALAMSRRNSTQGPCRRSRAPSFDAAADLDCGVQAPPTPRDGRGTARPPSASLGYPVAGGNSRPPSARLARPSSARPQSARSATARAPSQGRGNEEFEGGYLTERRSSKGPSCVPRPPLPRPPALASSASGHPAHACTVQAALMGSGRITPRSDREATPGSVGEHMTWCN